MAIIRQEINILCGTMTADEDSSAQIQIDTTQYSGSCLYYFEVVGKRASGTCTVTLHDAAHTVMATCSVTGTADALVRSSSFTPTSGAAVYHVNVAGGSTTPVIKAARIVIIQTSTPITATETQIEIGSAFNTISTTGGAPTKPKYWKYTSANWDGTLTVYFEAVLYSPSSKSNASVILQVADGTGDGFTGWADVTNGTVSTSATTATRVRGTSAITLVDGRNYRIVGVSPTSKSAMYVFCAKFIIQQAGVVGHSYSSTTGSSQGFSATDAGTGQSVTPSSDITVVAVSVWLSSDLGVTGNVLVELVSGSITGTVLGSGTFPGSSVPAGPLECVISLASSVALTASTQYFIRITKTTSVGWIYHRYQAIEGYAGGNRWRKNTGESWNEELSSDSPFKLWTVLLTKLEPQYLLVNTVFISSSLQSSPTRWDSSEWSGVSNTYKHAVDSINDPVNVAVYIYAGTWLPTSVVTNPDNQGISGSITMPSNQDIDVYVLEGTNTNLFSSRILVAVGPVTGPHIKKVAGVAWASVKKVAGVTNATAKKVAGESST
ncbi:MAG: Uncharacterized protein Athens071424_53 [Parcubacteria group bacterium Athens0714_24]|nr:MAG: Uncharacterized protein Athens071424_53 [Parcubacteria group bacterium Athens0714_24]